MADKRTERTIKTLDRTIILSHSKARVVVSDSIVVRHRVNVYVRDGPDHSHTVAHAELTPEQARKMAIALIEYATFIDNRTVA